MNTELKARVQKENLHKENLRLAVELSASR